MTKTFWKCAGIRALKTFFQTFAATFTVETVTDNGTFLTVLISSVIAACLSILTSLEGLPEVDLINESEKAENITNNNDNNNINDINDNTESEG